MTTQIKNELVKAGINYNRPEYGNLVQKIADAIDTVKFLGKEFWLEETTMGSSLKEIVFKLSK